PESGCFSYVTLPIIRAATPLFPIPALSFGRACPTPEVTLEATNVCPRLAIFPRRRLRPSRIDLRCRPAGTRSARPEALGGARLSGSRAPFRRAHARADRHRRRRTRTREGAHRGGQMGRRPTQESR